MSIQIATRTEEQNAVSEEINQVADKTACAIQIGQLRDAIRKFGIN